MFKWMFLPLKRYAEFSGRSLEPLKKRVLVGA